LPQLEKINCRLLRVGVGESVDAQEVKPAGDVLTDVLFKVGKVVFGVKARHLVVRSLSCVVNVESTIETSVDDQGVCHSDSLRFHGMLLRVDKLPEVLIVEVTYPPLALCLHHLFFISEEENE
jgi:hypothetical protein